MQMEVIAHQAIFRGFAGTHSPCGRFVNG
jgi:hypothetical protein